MATDNSINVLDIETFVRQFMVEQIKKTQPELDTGENSSFDDIFVKPMIAVASQMMQAISLVEYRTNLKYADKLTDDQVSDIGINNYNVARKSGERSHVIQTFSFSEISENGLTIPAGVVVTSDDGYAFYTASEEYFTKSALLSGYDNASKQYNVTVTMYAQNTGSDYNKGANTINTCQTNFNSALVSTTNMSAAIGGTDTESIADYVERMRTYYASQHLGCKPGYELFILNLFSTLKDVKVIGYGDVGMERDTISYIPADKIVDGALVEGFDAERDIVTRHIGGCVDIYVKGSEYKLISQNITSTSRFLLINKEIREFSESGEALTSAKDTYGDTYTCTVHHITGSEIESLNGKTLIVIGDKDFTEARSVKVEYTIEDGGEGVEVAETYLIDPAYETQVESPLSQEIVSAIYTDIDGNSWGSEAYLAWKKILSAAGVTGVSETTMSNEDCTIIRHKTSGEEISADTEFAEYYIGSTQEKNAVILSPYLPNTYVLNESYSGNGGSVQVTTSYNVTLNKLSASLTDDGNRIITGDILVREANTTPVSVSVEIELSDDTGLSELRRSQIHSVVSEIFDEAAVGGTIEQSDIVGELYSNNLTKSYIKYIRLPLKVFSKSSEVETGIKPDYISADSNSYLVLKDFSVSTISEAESEG